MSSFSKREPTSFAVSAKLRLATYGRVGTVGTLLPRTVDFADFRSLFIKAHSFGHFFFVRLPRDF